MKLTFSNDHNNITFRSEESSQIFEINRDNRLLVQRSELAKAHGEYTVDVEGQGCVFIQVTEIYLSGRRMFPCKKFTLFVQLYKKCYFVILCLSMVITTLSCIFS
jgi:hypothetical protein